MSLPSVRVSQSPEGKFREYLASRPEPKRFTSQQRELVEHIFARHKHFDPNELIEDLKQAGRQVSRATVYRTLPLLVESGVLREMDFGKDQKYYDPNFNQHPHHNHLICVDCDRIVEFEDKNIETLENCITKRLGFSPASKIVRIEATCDQLKLLGECKNRPKPG